MGKKQLTLKDKWLHFGGLIIFAFAIILTLPLILIQTACKYLALFILIMFGLIGEVFGFKKHELINTISEQYKKIDEIARW